MRLILPYAYFPSISYMAALLGDQSKVQIEAHENFYRQSIRTRCFILGGNGPLALNIPVRGARKKIKITDMVIDNSQQWHDQHWKSITSVYSRSPFFEHYESDLKALFGQGAELLHDFLMLSMTLCLKMLGASKELEQTDLFIHDYGNEALDLRWVFDAKSISSWPDFFSPVPYTQLFGKRFVANLSVLDAIFCEGPAAASIVRSSFGGWKK